MREKKNYLEAKECSKFRRRTVLRDMTAFFTLKRQRKLEFYRRLLQAFLSAVALPFVSKVELNFEVML